MYIILLGRCKCTENMINGQENLEKLMYSTFYAKNRTRVCRHFKTIISTMTYKPDDAPTSICYYELTALLQQIQLVVCQVIAYQTSPLHTIGCKTVTRLYCTDSQRKFY